MQPGCNIGARVVFDGSRVVGPHGVGLGDGKFRVSCVYKRWSKMARAFGNGYEWMFIVRSEWVVKRWDVGEIVDVNGSDRTALLIQRCVPGDGSLLWDFLVSKKVGGTAFDLADIESGSVSVCVEWDSVVAPLPVARWDLHGVEAS